MNHLKLVPPPNINEGVNPLMTPWFAALEYRPIKVGPYECKVAYPAGAAVPKSHYRWWNGVDWSYPIESDLNEEFQAPVATHYPVVDGEHLPFIWRGFNTDQDPL